MSFVTPTLKELGLLATDLIGDCVGMRWQSLPGGRYRFVHVLFRSGWSARRFVRALRRRHIWCLPEAAVNFKRLRDENDVEYVGWAATAIVKPDPAFPNG